MAMEFEKAIAVAPTLFLFDRRSQQQLHDMAEAAESRSPDRYLIRLSQAAFAYYNALEAGSLNMSSVIRQSRSMLQEVKRYRKDRTFYVLSLRFEVDLLMHMATLQFAAAPARERGAYLFTETDERALSICETLLKNFPESYDPLPNQWVASYLPLLPPMKEEILDFYKETDKEERMEHIVRILTRVYNELVVCAGIIRTKKFLRENGIKLNIGGNIKSILMADIAKVSKSIEDHFPAKTTLLSDIALPRGITTSMLDNAISNVQGQIEQAKSEKDVRRFCNMLLQQGILNFLNDNNDESVRVLISALRATRHISAEDKKLRQYRHEEFPDIPFMIGSSYLRLSKDHQLFSEKDELYMQKSMSGLMQAIFLQPRYHQAYVNLMVTIALLKKEEQMDEIIRLYLARFGNDINQISGLVFRNRAFLEARNSNAPITPSSVRWVLLSFFCKGGQQSKAVKMLQELKTLYLLNAHDLSINYLMTYQTAFRTKEEEFIEELESDYSLHSAILFYIAHAFASTALVEGKIDNEFTIDHDNLDQSVELNGESLYFNPENTSAQRLVETQVQIIQFAMARSEKRWENINTMMAQRFQYFEDLLRQEKSYKLLVERLTDLELQNLVPPVELSQSAQNKINSVISSQQQDRFRVRVEETAG